MSENLKKEEIEKYLAGRREFSRTIHQSVGKQGAEVCAAIHKQHGPIMRSIAVAAVVELAETTLFSASELNLVKQGLNIFADFFEKSEALLTIEAEEEAARKEEAKEEAAEKPESEGLDGSKGESPLD